MEIICSQTVYIFMMTDRLSVFEDLTSMSTPTEKRLKIDRKSVLESCHKIEITDVAFAICGRNIVDSLTKIT